MKEVITPKEEFTVAITRRELHYLRELTQNPFVIPDDEDPTEKQLRLSIFVGASRLLGYSVNDDGSINRGTFNV